MSRRNVFQYELIKSRWSFPLVVCLLILFFFWRSQSWVDFIPLGMALIISYVLMEMNTSFVLIHTRTSIPSVFYLLSFATLSSSHTWSWYDVLPLLFLLLLSSLFSSYETADKPITIFHAFFLWGGITLCIPSFIVLTPVLFLMMSILRAMSLRHIGAGITGWGASCWVGMVYLWATHQIDYIFTFFSKDWFTSIDYSLLSFQEWVISGMLLFIVLFCSILVQLQLYKEKVQTRIFFQNIFLLQLVILVFMIVQPLFLMPLLPVQLSLGSFMFGFYYGQVYTKFTAYAFSISWLLILSLLVYNLWTK